MRTDFVSDQFVEVSAKGEIYTETVFEIGLHCTAKYVPGHFDPYDGGYPPEGPEFEVTTIEVKVPKVNYRAGLSKGRFLSPLTLTYEQFLAIVGLEIGEKLINDAMSEAAETGEF
jgi:hypothetical protein